MSMKLKNDFIPFTISYSLSYKSLKPGVKIILAPSLFMTYDKNVI